MENSIISFPIDKFVSRDANIDWEFGSTDEKVEKSVNFLDKGMSGVKYG